MVGLPGVHIEVKRTERLDLYGALDQARRDARPGELPIVVTAGTTAGGSSSRMRRTGFKSTANTRPEDPGRRSGLRRTGMRILAACEESQAVTIEMRALGHEAYSCDLVPCSGGHPEWHLQCDALELLKIRWDMIIAFPPCTYLTAAGAVRLYNRDHTIRDPERDDCGRKAAGFFYAILNADCPKIAVENPVPMKRYGLPPYSQVIEPYMFGHPYMEK